METEAFDAWEILAECWHVGKALRKPGQQLCHFFINHPKNSLEKTRYSPELVIFALDTKIRIMA